VFASHPDNDTRLQQAIAGAGQNAAQATGNIQNSEGFLREIEGLPIGASGHQGIVRGNRFYHSDMQFTLAFPQGWQVVNQPDKILAVSPQKDNYMEIRTQAPPADLTDPRAFATRGLANRRVDHTETMDVNGLKGWTGIVRGDPSPFGQSTSVRYIIIYYANLMWVFKGASRSGMETPRATRSSSQPRTRSGACAPTSSHSRSPTACTSSVRPTARRWRSSRREPAQEVPAAAAPALQQPLPRRRAEAGRLRQDGEVAEKGGRSPFSGDCPRPDSFTNPLPHLRRQRDERLPAMAHEILVCGRHLGRGEFLAGDDEKRVVAEATGSPTVESRRGPPRTLPRRPATDRPRCARKRSHSGSARRDAQAGTPASSARSLSLFACSSGNRPRVARRMDARPSAERVHLDPRVVCDRGQPRDLRSVARLDERIRDEAVAVLNGGRDAEIGLRDDLEVVAGEDFAASRAAFPDCRSQARPGA
jgi:hypothetical protein